MKGTQDVPPMLSTPVNERVLAYLAPLSAHSDIASALTDAVEPLGDVQLFSPDSGRYRYLLAATQSVVFGFASGQSTVAFRLDPRMKARALATGGESLPECGDEWVAVLHALPDSDWPAVDVRFWARKSYVHARSIPPRARPA